ncbi:cytochrome P450, partial [Periconia macrospinosa]
MDIYVVLVSLLGAWLLYLLFLTYHRLFLSPISHFPGPKLAAASFWYEFYYDIILGGKYFRKIKSLHEEYGPVVRINPGELHVADLAFWDIMYTASTNSNRRDKWSWQAKGLGIPLATVGAVGHALHRGRRSALNPFFSMQNVRTLLPVLEERVQVLVQRLAQSGEQSEIVSMEYAFSAFSNDVVMQYCFNRMDHHLEAPGFDPVYHDTSFTVGTMIALMTHFNWIVTIMRALPECIALKLGDKISAQVKLRREGTNQIEDVRRQIDAKQESKGNRTIFHRLLQSELPEAEKATSRLAEEAVLLVGAGTHTTSWCLTVIAFHLLWNSALLRKLKDELNTARSKAGGALSLSDLERLPYFTAVLKEGLRLGYGATMRSARIAPDASLKCGDWIIPPGTPVSMSIPLTHHDESIFPNSDTFDPERWLGDNANHLDRYLVSFSKGSRSCVGMNLAWAELYLCTAGVFSHYGSRDVQDSSDVGFLELFETDVGDVALVSDKFFPVAKEGSKGVRVKV